MEGLVPIIGGAGDMSLNLSLSARWDSYDAPDVVYRDTALGTTEKADDHPRRRQRHYLGRRAGVFAGGEPATAAQSADIVCGPSTQPVAAAQK